jgi:uncharacterized damage-inducible protein DinB
MSFRDDYITEAVHFFREYKALGDRAMAQVDDEAFFAPLDAESNSIALVVKHVSGNMRSRWTDFLNADGEKPDRHRDTEFVIDGDTRSSLTAAWEAGWQLVFDAVGSLSAEDLERRVTIRGQKHSILKAVNRQLTHYAYHVGQIVLLAKHAAGEEWESLSVPRGKSKAFNADMQERYGDWNKGTS